MDALAQRWHIPPSAVLAEDASLVLGIVVGAKPPEPTDDERRLSLLAGAMTVGE